MSTILQQMAEKQLRKTSEVSKRFTKSQQVVRYVPNIMKPKSQSQFRDRLIDGNYSIQMEIKKSVLDDIFQKIGPNFRREHLEYVTMQFESELVRVCNEFSQTELISKHSSFNIGFSKFMKQLLAKYDEMVQQVQLLQNTCNTQQQSHNQLTEQCKNLQLLLDKQVPDKKVQNTKEAAKRQNEIYMENLRLKNEVDRIKDRLKHFENVTNVQNLIQEIEQIKANSKQQINDLVSEIQLKDKQLQKLNLHYQNLKSQYSKLENESKAYQTIFEQNKIQLDKVTILNQKNESNMLKYREIALMQREDMDMRAFIVKEHLMVAQKAKDKLVQLQTKLDRFQIEKSKEIEPQPNRNFDQEKSGFDRLNDLLSNDKTFHRLNYQALVADKARVMVRIGHSVQVMEQFFNSQEIQLDKLTIGYAPFIQFVEHHKKTIETELNGLMYKRPSLKFLVTTRLILDAKWNEIQLGKSSGFSEFVYSWLMNFKLEGKEQKPLEPDPQRIDDQIVKFIVDLSNPVLQKNWECITFQEFINGCSCSDELYFYLYVRSMIFRGPQCSHKQALYDAAHYIPLLQAEFIVCHVLQQYEATTLVQVKRVLKEKAVQKIPNKNIYIIDSGFILRMLLEYYRVERRNRYKMLKMAFGNRASSITFKQFRIVMVANYPNSSDLELATLYRQAYSFTGSGVSIDSVYTAASDSGFFIQYLRLSPLIELPKLENNTLTFEIATNQQFIMVIEAYKRFTTTFPNFKEQLNELGLEEPVRTINQFTQLVDSKFTNQNDYGVNNFVQLVTGYIDLFRRVTQLFHSRLYQQDTHQYAQEFIAKQEEKNKLILAGQNKDNLQSTDCFYRVYLQKSQFPQDIVYIKGQLDVFDNLIQFNESMKDVKKKSDFLQTVAAKKIQKFIKKKMTKFYSFVSSLLSAKLRAQLKQKQAI